MSNRPRTPKEPRAPRRAPEPVPPSAAPKALASSVVGFVAAAAVSGVVVWVGCRQEPPPGASVAPTTAVVGQAPPPSASARPVAAPSASAPAPVASAEPVDAGVDAAKPYDGPLVGAIAMTAPVYAGMDWSKEKRLGYLRLGSKAPVEPTPIRASNCEAGWYKLAFGGYVCGKYVTLDLNHPQVRLGTTAPNLDDVLPYKYAYNTTNGTPLYHSVPSREEMLRYEPYLKGAKAKARERERTEDAGAAEPEVVPASDEVDAGTASVADAGEAPKRAWWEPSEQDGGKPGVKLADLTEGADAVLAQRMVKGFFIAVDKTFGWNGRLWHKTTTGLVAPADRFAVTKGPTFRGIELAGTDPKQPVGFILSTKARRYELAADGERTKVSVKSPVERMTIVRLTGTTKSVGGILYRETTEGWWMKSIEGTYTDPGAPPAGLEPGEKWIDVNLSRQTLVAFEGDVPVFATLVSTGRKGKDKAHDHKTIKGSFRIREKHIATTMDGDGPAPGDAPYSIQDVPYVEYFEGSYALHAAFWHSDYGHERSHGCVNLSPLDAKRIFFWTDPPLPQGWHGVNATREVPGTRVVVHD